MQISTDRLLTEVEASTAKLARIIRRTDPGLPVPACPDWTLRQLGTHLGRVHRWAAEIVANGAAEAIPMTLTSPDLPVPDLAVCGPPGQVLLVLLRRLSPEAGDITQSGDTALLTGWLAGTPFG